MTPQEVKGLQAIAKSRGGTLTINPETGLPEAGFLDDVLPVVAMAAATYFTAGAAAPALAGALGSAGMAAGTATTVGGALAGAGAGALYGGIGAGMQGKDVGQGALMGGIGGGITGGMGGYDNVFSAAGATPPVDPNLVNVPPGAVGPSIPADELAKQQTTQQTADLATRQAAAQADPTRALVAEPPGTVIDTQVGQAPPGMRINPETGDAYNQLVSTPNPNVVRPDSSYQTAGLMGKTAILAAPGIGGAMAEGPNQGIPGAEPYRRQATLSPNFQGYTPQQPDPYYRAQYTRYAAGGGLMNAYQAGGPVKRMSGGIASLGSYSDGGRMLKGPGDGMSDSIPATIANKRPARLADGEFVVPADVVSHLGNGSTNAGARKLYAMMDKVRRARTGKKKQAPAVNTGRFMPA
jgi:hypothetical protein